MAVQPDTTTGTITLTSGSVNFTTAGVNLQTRDHRPGDTIHRNGFTLVIASVTGQNSGTLTENCPAAAAGAGVPVRIRYQPDGSRVAAQARALIDLLGSGNVPDFAALDFATRRGLRSNGAGALETFELSDFALTILDDTSAGAARTTLGVPGLTGGNTYLADNQAAVYRPVAGETSYLRWQTQAGNAWAYIGKLADVLSIVRNEPGDININAGNGGRLLMRGTPTFYTPLPVGSGGTGASDAAGARANLGLSDAAVAPFEFGTWTPQLMGLTTPGSPTYAANSGVFVRIGRLVFITTYVVVTALGGATGVLSLTNLPFPIGGGTQGRPTFNVGFWGGLNLPAGTIGLNGFGIGAADVRFIRFSLTSGSGNVAHSDVSGTLTLYGTMTYVID